MVARPASKSRIETAALLRLVAEHGRHWPQMLADHEVAAVNDVVDRAQLDGLMSDAVTLTSRGRDLLAGCVGERDVSGRIGPAPASA